MAGSELHNQCFLFVVEVVGCVWVVCEEEPGRYANKDCWDALDDHDPSPAAEVADAVHESDAVC